MHSNGKQELKSFHLSSLFLTNLLFQQKPPKEIPYSDEEEEDDDDEGGDLSKYNLDDEVLENLSFQNSIVVHTPFATNSHMAKYKICQSEWHGKHYSGMS